MTQEQRAIPNRVLYLALFRHVRSLEAFGNHLEAEGHSGAFVRSQIKRQARLTDQQEAALKAIAADWAAAVAAIDVHQTNATAQRDAITLSHMSQLSAAYGAAFFEKFDAWARAYEGPNISYGSAKTQGGTNK